MLFDIIQPGYIHEVVPYLLLWNNSEKSTEYLQWLNTFEYLPSIILWTLNIGKITRIKIVLFTLWKVFWCFKIWCWIRYQYEQTLPRIFLNSKYLHITVKWSIIMLFIYTVPTWYLTAMTAFDFSNTNITKLMYK